MADEKDKHCYECAGKAKAIEEPCSTCDGKGNLKTTEKASKKRK